MTTTTPTRTRFLRVLTVALVATGALAAAPAGASNVPGAPSAAVPSAGTPATIEKFGPFDLYITLDWTTQNNGLYDVVVVRDLSQGANRDWLLASTADFAIPKLTEYAARFNTAIIGERSGRPRKHALYHVRGAVVAETLCPNGGRVGVDCDRRTYIQVTEAKLLPGKCAIGHIHAKSWLLGKGKKIGLGVCGTAGTIYVGGGNALNELRNPAKIRIDQLTFKAPRKKTVTVTDLSANGTIITATEPIELAVPVSGGTCKAKIGGLIDTVNDGKPAKAATKTVSLSFPC
jgi:hypothetical protein